MRGLVEIPKFGYKKYNSQEANFLEKKHNLTWFTTCCKWGVELKHDNGA